MDKYMFLYISIHSFFARLIVFLSYTGQERSPPRDGDDNNRESMLFFEMFPFSVTSAYYKVETSVFCRSVK